LSLRAMLAEAAAQYGQKTAIVCGDHRLSFTDLDEASNRLANALIEMGVAKGDRIALLLSNSPEFAVVYFGIVKAGALAVPLDARYRTDELASLFADCRPKVIVAERPLLDELLPVLPRFDSIRQVIDLTGRHKQFLSYQQVLARGSVRPPGVRLDPEDSAQLAYTSGPAFCPRGIELSQHSLVLSAAASAEGFQQTDRDVMMLFILPLHHMFGLVAQLLASIYKGSTLVMVPGTGLSIGSFLAAVEKEKGTMFLGVPYVFALAVDMAEREGIRNDLGSLRICVSAGAPLSIDLIRRFKKHYGFDLFDCWGLSETVCHITCAPIAHGIRPGSIGKPLRGWEVKVVGDDGHELAPGQHGEIIARGPMMKGYYNNPRATAEVVRDGWLYTGDIGKIDEDGYIFITGRKKDLIIIKGQNIHPSDIESVLQAHPKVAEAAAIGAGDELRGEVIVAVIALKSGDVVSQTDIKRFCLEHMVSYKAPKEVIVVDSLPRTAAGEIDKETIRRRLSLRPPFP